MLETAKPHLNHENYAYLGLCIRILDTEERALTLSLLTLKEWCRSQNITELRLDVYHDNPSAIRAYEKQALKVNMRVGL
jgi:ribosomal protein S18 acetylase RimI-like enzyme